ncbi:unnamed protein product, partial [Symbiodinium sp. CCMP2592]
MEITEPPPVPADFPQEHVEQHVDPISEEPFTDGEDGKEPKDALDLTSKFEEAMDLDDEQ